MQSMLPVLHHNARGAAGALQKRGLHDVVKAPATGKVFVRAGQGRASDSGHIATVFGATGFLGGYVVSQLARHGTQVVTPWRGEENEKRHLKVMGDLGQIVQPRYDLRLEDTIASALKYSDFVVNAVGRDHQTKNFTFEQVHVDGARKIARLAREHGVSKLVHVSAVGAHVDAKSPFHRSKALGEIAVREEFPNATIVRIPTMYGAEDRFWNRLGFYTKYCPWGLPVPNGGKTILRPAYVADVGAAIARMIDNPNVDGKLVELYGPRAYEYSSIIDFFLDVSKRDAFVWNAPKPIAKLLATATSFTQYQFYKPEDVDRFFVDEVPQDKSALTFADLGINPATVENTILKFVRLYRPAEFQRAPYEASVKRYLGE
ncbi:hypothetical protein DFJ73DRAFT_806318, partial [Zopfochytrium polystomum]